MDGLTIKNSNRLASAGLGDLQRIDVGGGSSTSKTSGADAAGGASFGDTLTKAIGQVNEMQKTADKGMENLATGRTDNIADVMLQTEKADIALKLMVQVRNKIIDAYSEIMRMQV